MQAMEVDVDGLPWGLSRGLPWRCGGMPWLDMGTIAGCHGMPAVSAVCENNVFFMWVAYRNDPSLPAALLAGFYAMKGKALFVICFLIPI